MADETRVRLLNVKPETWALLKENNRDRLPLEAEHDSDWHEYDGRLSSPDYVLSNLKELGSPEALLYLEVTDYEGYKNVGIYQLDSRTVRSIHKFNRKVCQVLGLEVLPHRVGRSIEHCIDTKTLNGKLAVMLSYGRWGGVFTYNISVWTYSNIKVRGTTLEDLSIKCTVKGLRNLHKLKPFLSIGSNH